MDAKVVLADCADYELERVYAAVRQCLEPLGGMSAFVRPGQRVLLQVNLISPRPAEDAVCTHPSLVQATCRLVQEVGGLPSVGGSAGGPAHRTRRALAVSGIADAAASVGAEVLDYSEVGGQDVQVAGALMSTLHIARPVLETDVLVTLPKLKTHTLTLLTCAVKNHLGTLPGPRKAELHRRFPDPEQFGEALLDVYVAAQPHLAIVDGVQGMDGDGPTAGRVRQVGLVAASADGVALDAVMCAVCGLDPRWVPTLLAARRRGTGTASLDRIEVVGVQLEAARARLRPFAYPITYRLLGHSWVPQGLRHLFAKHVGGYAKPHVVASKCNGCQTCVKSCPEQTIAVVGKRARIDQRRCISCFCCHELCPEQAIEFELPLMWRLVRF